MHYINCRYCYSTGSENICSTCCLIDEHKGLPSIKAIVKRRQTKKLTPKQIAAQECFRFVKNLKTEDVDF